MEDSGIDSDNKQTNSKASIDVVSHQQIYLVNKLNM